MPFRHAPKQDPPIHPECPLPPMPASRTPTIYPTLFPLPAENPSSPFQEPPQGPQQRRHEPPKPPSLFPFTGALDEPHTGFPSAWRNPLRPCHRYVLLEPRRPFRTGTLPSPSPWPFMRPDGRNLVNRSPVRPSVTRRRPPSRLKQADVRSGPLRVPVSRHGTHPSFRTSLEARTAVSEA